MIRLILFYLMALVVVLSYGHYLRLEVMDALAPISHALGQ